MTFVVGDLFHVGHLNLLERARKLGDYLIVGVASTWSNLEEVKHRETIISGEDRLRIISALRCVDFAFLYAELRDLEESIRLMKPDLVCRGDDWQDFPGRRIIDELKIPIKFLPYTQDVSSTIIRGRINDSLD